MSFVPTLIERGLGGGALVAVAALFAWSGLSAVTALGARWLPPSVSPRVQLVAGLVGCAAGQLALVGLTPGSSIGRLLPGVLVARERVAERSPVRSGRAVAPAARPLVGPMNVTRASICGSDLWPYKMMDHSDAGCRRGHAFIGMEKVSDGKEQSSL